MPWVVWRLHGFLKTLFFCFLFFCFWGVVLDEIYNFLAPQGTRSPVCWTLTVSSFFFLSFFFGVVKEFFIYMPMRKRYLIRNCATSYAMYLFSSS